MPATQPAIVARRSSHGQNRARNAAGSVWSIHTPPASWKLTTYVDGTARMNATAPTLTVSEVSFEIRVSVAGLGGCVTSSR